MNEKELIEGLRRAEEPAFRWLVTHFQNKVLNTALNILQDEKEAEDAAQETFIQVFESINKFREESSLATWITRIATHKSLDKIRRRKSRERLRKVLPWWMPEDQKVKQELFEHPGIVAENREKAAILFKAIDRLPEKQRLAFTLIKVQGMSYEEVCQIMNQQLKAVESLITRAKQNLQQSLEVYYQNQK